MEEDDLHNALRVGHAQKSMWDPVLSDQGAWHLGKTSWWRETYNMVSAPLPVSLLEAPWLTTFTHSHGEDSNGDSSLRKAPPLTSYLC